MKYLYYNPHAAEFRLFSPEHITALCLIAVLAVLMIVFRERLQALPEQTRRRLEIGAGVLLLLARSGMYLYYFTYGIGVKEVLPLYACRLVILAILYTLFTGRRRWVFFFYYFGIIFGVLPLIVVDTSGYTFPHAMYFSFFVGHGIILLVNIYFLAVYQYYPGRNDLRKAVQALVVYFGAAALANFFLKGNYNYLEAAPPTLNMGGFDGSLGYKFMVFAVFLLVFGLEYLPFAKGKESETEEEESPIKMD